MKKSRITLFVVALLILGLTAVGFAADPKYGGSYRVGMMSNPPTLDPVFATDTSSAEVLYNIVETLVTYDNEGDVVPQLAESWDISDDGLVYTFHLRKGVKFHAAIEGGTPTENGGREVTAYDWEWTFNYICDPEVNSPRAYFIDMVKGYQEYRDGKTDKISGIKAIDDYTLQIEITYPFAPFISVLAYQTFSVIPKEDVLKWGDQFAFHPVGTGPFVFDEWVQDSKVVLKRNPNYWDTDENGNQLPYLDEVVYQIIPEETMRWEEFEMGNLEKTDVGDPFYLEAKKKYPDTFFERPMLGTYYYGMNVEKPPFDNKKVRQAMNYAINREVMLELVMNGRGTPAKGVLPPGMFGYNEDLKGYTYDPEKAKQLLEEAGYPDGFEVTLQYNTSQGHKRIAEALQAQYAQIGIKVKLQNVDWGTHLDSVERGEVPFFRMGWVADYNDPDNFLYVLLNSENIGPQGNYSRYHNPVFDQLTKEGRLETNPEARRKLYQEAEQIVVEDAPWVFIYHYTTHALVQPYVKGFVLPSFGAYTVKLKYVWLDK